MQDNSDDKKRKKEKLPPGIIPIDMTYLRITSVYGPPELEDDPQVQELHEAGDGEQGE